MQNNILSRVDDATLISAINASPRLFGLCDDKLWRRICNSIWRSTTYPRVVDAISAHRSFYLDCIHSMANKLPNQTCSPDTTSKLISAVDIYYKNRVIYSKAFETETVSDWFLSNPLRLQLLGQEQILKMPLRSHFQGDDSACISLAQHHLRVSWILIDPTNKRAVNVSSQKAVECKIWTNEISLVYATVAALSSGKVVQFSVDVICGWPAGGRILNVTHVGMKIENIKGESLCGRESVGILRAAMEGRRRKIDSKMEKAAYRKFLWKKELLQRWTEVFICIFTFGLPILFTLFVVFLVLFLSHH